MKILTVIPAIGNVYGGPSKSVIELAEAITQQGINVDLVTTNANGDQTLDVPLYTWNQNNNVRIQYFSYLGWQDYKWSFALGKWLFQHVKEYDLVHTNAVFSLNNLPAYWACQCHQIPYIVTPRGMLEPWALAYKAQKKLAYFKLLERPALQKASAIQVLAKSEAERIQPLQLNSPLVTVPNGIHCHHFAPPASAEPFRKQFPHLRDKQLILFLGRIDPKKGLDLLAPAFAQVHQQFPNSHLIIAGPDNIGYLPTAQKLFQDVGGQDAVTFTGILNGDLKYSALAAASVYVAPSYSEGFSISILEGLASGLPCVFTDACNFPEASDVAKIVPVDFQQIAQALHWCFANPEEAKAMGQQAREFIFEHYTWDKIAANLVQIYDAIIHNQPLPHLHA
ncbi:glycosyltransferase [Synechocystis sp. LEGE 06083]|uniref:glycosyltransferase n=1 Tax=Synechocystis sp. LEGE 06083 TaxID=915336 RepID=UPI001882CEDA|nr:glycosyltransferase [Synechocystis sp. LEGE 06083]MBE9196776.1 glycosyltransferase [Synechocystis sp. LEGE 06083]